MAENEYTANVDDLAQNQSVLKLKHKRTLLKSQLTRFSTFLNNTENTNLEEIAARLEKISFNLESYNEIQTEIEYLSGGNIDEPEREEFETKFYSIIGKAKKMLRKGEVNTFNGSETNANVDLKSKVRLPPINLPEFQGNYSQWLTFYDVFNSLVHTNGQLNNTQKFCYLKSCLKGDAAILIQSIEISSDNYEVAFEMLRNRYENKRLIVHTHMKAIFDANSVKNESYSHLRSLLDNLNKNLRALKALKQPVDNWDTPLTYIIVSKLDTVTKREWEEYLNKSATDFPTTAELIDFLTKRCNFLETLENKCKNDRQNKHEIRSDKVLTHVTSVKITCAFCKQNHLNFQCEKIHKMERGELHAQIKKHKLCLNCLRPYHDHKVCTSNGCKHCGRKHNTLLHVFYNNSHSSDTVNTNSGQNGSIASANKNAGNNNQTGAVSSTNVATSTQTSTNANNANSNTLNLTCFSQRNLQVALATATIKILDANGEFIFTRAILDSASQSNFMTNSLAKRLGLRTATFNVPVVGINECLSKISKKVNAKIYSVNGKYHTTDSFLLVEKITENLPQVSFKIHDLDIPCSVDLADKEFNLSQPVDLLLGVNIFFDILCVGQIKMGKDKPILHKTKLGWVVAGNMNFQPLYNENTVKSIPTICNVSTTNEDLCKQMEKFWVLENDEASKNKSLPEEALCEKNFVQNYKRLDNGRFEVSLPFKKNTAELGDSKTNAVRRFYALEKRLERNENLKQDYCNFMSEYINLQHMSLVDDDTSSNSTYYLPHHGVMKTDSTTTKLRVVFDGSAKTDTGFSLNDILMTGPVIQRDLFAITLNFRIHNVVFVADIEKMYRQVLIRDFDRPFQRIVWRFNQQDEIKHYNLNTVTYGTAPASFLAIRALNQAALDNIEQFPEASRTILNSFYVDDLLTGSDSIENAIILKNQIVKILTGACFPLRKFYSNKREVLVDCDRGQLENYDLSEDKTRKTLGLLWHPNNDEFVYSINVNLNIPITKREILSVIAKIFDPLGLVSPITVRAKIIMQRLWQSKISWDESVPADIFTSWKSFFVQLFHLNSIKIPRQVTIPEYTQVELHGFSDASEVAYAACVYVVCTDTFGKRHSKLLCAKSRIAPIKVISVPRLELCGAVLLAKLVKRIKNDFDLNIESLHLWSDSTIALSWIASEPNYWNTFVANRVTQIQEVTDKGQWRHVISKQNPADILSRGLTIDQLESNSLWWQGPQFLLERKENWPISVQINQSSDTPERKKTTQTCFLNANLYQDQTIFEKCSNYIKLIRVFAYILRFVSNSRCNDIERIIGELTPSELNNSLNNLIKLVQWSEYSQEITDLTNGSEISKKSKLISLNPFLDRLGILRVGGRIRHSNLTADVKHPILLPPYHKFTRLLIKYEHNLNFHAGTLTLLAIVRLNYWIIHGKNAIKREIHKCVVCFKCRPSINRPMMGDLPKARLIPSRPFLTVGCDYAGPIMIKDGKLRSRKLVKCYISIFICFVTRAVHIELAGDLSTECFLNVLKRFIARRGLCKDIYTDNGKNFIGANSELRKLYQSTQQICKNVNVCRFLSEHDIHWHFIPPRAPSFGGLWEAAVKSAKFHLCRVLKNAHLTYEGLYTVICQIEAILNSRPLTPLSSDPNDLTALTPGHLLIGDSLVAVPQRDVGEVQTNRLKLYERWQQIVQHFWKRWSAEYLTSLQSRCKWRSSKGALVKEGDLVLLHEQNIPSQQWLLGRIVELHPGLDKTVRVVSVKTRAGVFKRAVNKISVLPINDEQS